MRRFGRAYGPGRRQLPEKGTRQSGGAMCARLHGTVTVGAGTAWLRPRALPPDVAVLSYADGFAREAPRYL
jgi:hypothetical protein